MNKQDVLDFHLKHREKISVCSKINLQTEDMSVFYTPGISVPCMEISNDLANVWKYTGKSNTVAVVSDGTAVLGLGDIGAHAAIPVMESKCVFFKEISGINAVPICITETNPDKLKEIVKEISPVFGGINLEDVASPKCFKLEEELQKELDIPVFHADQHGTSIVVAAALLNALEIVSKELSNVKIVINGPGASGVAIVNMLLDLGASKLVVCDEDGILSTARQAPMQEYKYPLIEKIPLKSEPGSLKDALFGADVFIGVSVGKVATEEMVASMQKDAIVFALAGPVPEIPYDDAKKAGARIAATGSAEHKNQINNSAVFPGVFKGALSVEAREINAAMKRAAVFALKESILPEHRTEENILPDPMDLNAAEAIARAVACAAIDSGAARKKKGFW